MAAGQEVTSTTAAGLSEHITDAIWDRLTHDQPFQDPRVVAYLGQQSTLYDDLLRYCSDEHIDIDTLPDSQPFRFARLICGFCNGCSEDTTSKRSSLFELHLPVIASDELTAAVGIYNQLVTTPEQLSPDGQQALTTFQTTCRQNAQEQAGEYLEISLGLLFASALEQEGCTIAANRIRTDCLSIWGAALLAGGNLEVAGF